MGSGSPGKTPCDYDFDRVEAFSLCVLSYFLYVFYSMIWLSMYVGRVATL